MDSGVSPQIRKCKGNIGGSLQTTPSKRVILYTFVCKDPCVFAIDFVICNCFFGTPQQRIAPCAHGASCASGEVKEWGKRESWITSDIYCYSTSYKSKHVFRMHFKAATPSCVWCMAPHLRTETDLWCAEATQWMFSAMWTGRRVSSNREC